jgi:mono/diheme cytochrome c family protein
MSDVPPSDPSDEKRAAQRTRATSIGIAVASALASIVLAVAVRPTSGAPDAVQFLGRFHTLAIHVPIGVLMAVAAAELLTLSPRLKKHIDPALDLALRFLVITGSAGFILGLLLARGGGYPSKLIAMHRGFTLGAIVGSAICAVAWAYRQRGAYRGALGLTVLLITIGAHYGGSMTRGETYLVKFAPGPLRALLGEAEPTPEPAPKDTPPTAEPLVFADAVMPMLKQRCVECHGSSQAKGGLRLDSFAAVQKGGDNGPVVVAGSGGKSSLVTRMTLPAGNNDRMPPDDKPSPTTDEIELVRWWIDRGATDTARVRDAVLPDGARALLAKAVVALPASNTEPATEDKPATSASPTAAPEAKPAPVVVASVPRSGPRLVYRDVVAPILAARCASCHGADKQKGKLRVDSIEAMLAGGKGGPSIVAGSSTTSSLITRANLAASDDKHMPPAKEPQLTSAELELVAWWIDKGASPKQTASELPAKFASFAPPAPPVAKPAEPKGAPSSTPSAEPSAQPAKPPTGKPVRLYADVVAPMLDKRCGNCHIGKMVSGGLHVDDREKMIKDGDLIPGQPDKSPLLTRILVASSDSEHMPPADKPQATASEIEALRVWIGKGASLDGTVDSSELPPDLLTQASAVAIVTPSEAKPPPALRQEPSRSGCAACTVGGSRDGEEGSIALTLAGVLATALVARRRRARQ